MYISRPSGRGLVQQLNDLLGHEEWGSVTVNGLGGYDEDLADKEADVVVGGKGCEGWDGELDQHGLQVAYQGLQDQSAI